MVRPGRDRLSGRVEVDESYVGGLEEGVRGRQTETIASVAVACEEDGKGIGRIRRRRITDASAASVQAFVEEAVQPGSVFHTDGWEGYTGLETRRVHSRSDGVEAAPAVCGCTPPQGCIWWSHG